MKEIINTTCRIFVKNLSEKPIIYSGVVEEIEDVGNNVILTLLDMKNIKVRINFNDIIQILQDEGDY